MTIRNAGLFKSLQGAQTEIMKRGGYTGVANDNPDPQWLYDWLDTTTGKRHITECKSHTLAYNAAWEYFIDNERYLPPYGDSDIEIRIYRYRYDDENERADETFKAAFV